MNQNPTNVEYRQACLEQGIDLGSVGIQLAGYPDGTPTLGTLPEGMEPGQLEPFTAPGAVDFRPERWWDPEGDGSIYQYQLASGDTLSGLAATYLGDPNRWEEIWAEQPSDYRAARSPDVVYEGEWRMMPKEAGDNAKQWAGGELPGTQASGGGEDQGTGGGTTEELGGEEPTAAPSKGKTLLIVGGLAALAIVGYLALK